MSLSQIPRVRFSGFRTLCSQSAGSRGPQPWGAAEGQRTHGCGDRRELGGRRVQERSSSCWWSQVRCSREMGRGPAGSHPRPHPAPHSATAHAASRPWASLLCQAMPQRLPGPQPHAGVLGSPPDTRRVKKPLNRPEAMQGLCVDSHGSQRRRLLSPASLGEACCPQRDTAEGRARAAGDLLAAAD